MNAKAEPLTGKELLRAAVNQILDHPETWNQGSWHCKTSHCFGGWCQILSGERESDEGIEDLLVKKIGISNDDANWITAPDRNLPQIHGFASAFLQDKKYFRAGFDRAGFDRDGFNCDGFDRAGFDRDGFNRAGFDKNKNRLPRL